MGLYFLDTSLFATNDHIFTLSPAVFAAKPDWQVVNAALERNVCNETLICHFLSVHAGIMMFILNYEYKHNNVYIVVLFLFQE